MTYTLFPEIQPYQTHKLQVSDLHTLYVEECGNPNGEPILFIHGGPGAGFGESDRRFFDPKKYRIILFDQRGCGKSSPYLELQENTTQNLIEDIEKIRELLTIESWRLFGGSWGATLTLLYAQAYPKRIVSMVLRGVFLFQQSEIDWFLGGGVQKLYPKEFAEFKNFIPEKERANGLVEPYYNRILSDDVNISNAAALSLSKYEISIAQLVQDPKTIQDFLNSPSGLSMGRIEMHYMQNKGFIEEGQILKNAYKITDIPCQIVQGRYDTICPLITAFELHQALPKSSFHPVISGHNSKDPAMLEKLIEVTNYL